MTQYKWYRTLFFRLNAEESDLLERLATTLHLPKKQVVVQGLRLLAEHLDRTHKSPKTATHS